jgi:CheY-like chemotaxis protein
MVIESIAENKSYDLVLLDSVMVNMHGPQAAAKMRAEGIAGLIIGLTGNALPEDVQAFKDQGANQVLIKPLERELLLQLLKEEMLLL